MKDKLQGLTLWRRPLGLLALAAAVLLLGVLLRGSEQRVAQHREVKGMVSSRAPAAKPAIIITDLAFLSDDSVAIAMLLKSKVFDFKAMITTNGNVCSYQAALDTSRLLRLVGSAVPVIEGPALSWHAERRNFYEHVERPSWDKPAYIGAFEPSSTCGGVGTPDVHRLRNEAAEVAAADFLIEQARAGGGYLNVILQGPATVLHQAQSRDSHIKDLIERVYAMGGALDVPGNVTTAAEFNFWFDPEAIAEVISTGPPMTLVPLDATGGVTYPLLRAEPKDAVNPAQRHLEAYLSARQARSREVPMWDEVLAAIVIDASIVEQSEHANLRVSTSKTAEYGMLSRQDAGDASLPSRGVRVVRKVNAVRVRELMTRLLKE
jgi:inosine-uridine nucleoside N-ribohydrolase